MQDHVAMGGLTFTVNAPISINLNRVYSLKAVMQYAVMGGGPLTIPGGVEGLGFVNTKYVNASEDFPDIQYHFVSGKILNFKSTGSVINPLLVLEKEQSDKSVADGRSQIDR